MGPAGPEKFWNAAAEIESPAPRERIREDLRRVEALLGRKRDHGDKFAARTIDLDLLPQPGYTAMPFIMIPLAEIAPEAVDPVTGMNFEILCRQLDPGKQICRKIG